MKLGMMGFQSGIGRPYFCTESPSIMVKWKVPFTVFFFAEYLQKYMVFYCLFVLTMYLRLIILNLVLRLRHGQRRCIQNVNAASLKTEYIRAQQTFER